MINLIRDILDRNNYPYTFDGTGFTISYNGEDCIYVRPRSSTDLYDDLVTLSDFIFDICIPYRLFQLEELLRSRIYGIYQISYYKDSIHFAYIGHQDMDIISFKEYVESLLDCKLLSVSSFDGTYTMEF